MTLPSRRTDFSSKLGHAMARAALQKRRASRHVEAGVPGTRRGAATGCGGAPVAPCAAARHHQSLLQAIIARGLRWDIAREAACTTWWCGARHRSGGCEPGGAHHPPCSCCVLPAPMVVVRNAADQTYQNLLVAVDFSQASHRLWSWALHPPHPHVWNCSMPSAPANEGKLRYASVRRAIGFYRRVQATCARPACSR